MKNILHSIVAIPFGYLFMLIGNFFGILSIGFHWISEFCFRSIGCICGNCTEEELNS